MVRELLVKSRLAFGMAALIALVVVGCSSEAEEVVAPKKEAIQQKLPEVKKFEPLHSLIKKAKNASELLELMRKSGRIVKQSIDPTSLKNSPSIQYVGSSGSMTQYFLFDTPSPDNWNGTVHFRQQSASYGLVGSAPGSPSNIIFTANNYNSGLDYLHLADSYLMVADLWSSRDFTTGYIASIWIWTNQPPTPSTSVALPIPAGHGGKQLYVYLSVSPLSTTGPQPAGHPVPPYYFRHIWAPLPGYSYPEYNIGAYAASAAYELTIQE